MDNKPLDLDALAKLAAEYAPGEVWLYDGSDVPEWGFNRADACYRLCRKVMLKNCSNYLPPCPG